MKSSKHPSVARQAIKDKLALLRRMDALLSKSTLSEKDALELGAKTNKAVAKKFKVA